MLYLKPRVKGLEGSQGMEEDTKVAAESEPVPETEFLEFRELELEPEPAKSPCDESPSSGTSVGGGTVGFVVEDDVQVVKGPLRGSEEEEVEVGEAEVGEPTESRQRMNSGRPSSSSSSSRSLSE